MMGKSRKIWAMLISMAILMQLILVMPAFAEYGNPNKDQQVYVDETTGAAVGNASFLCQNLALILAGRGNKNPEVPGFKRIGDLDWGNREASINSKVESEYGGGARICVDNRSIEYTIKIADNDVLRNVALSGEAQMCFKGKAGGDNGWNWDAYGEIYINKNGKQIIYASENGWGSPAYFDTGWFSVDADDEFYIKITGGSNKDDKVVQGVEDFLILFKDDVRPTLNNYTFETNGIEHSNTVSGKRELLVPQYSMNDNDTLSSEKGYMDLKFNFSETVQTEFSNEQWYPLAAPEGTLINTLANHVLFTNPCNTGYSRMGEQARLKLVGVKDINNSWVTTGEPDALMRTAGKTFNFRYTAERGDFSSNKAIPNYGDWSGNSCTNNVQSLVGKFEDAHFHDCAGNAAILSGISQADQNGNVSINEQNINPFEYYDVIVDAEPPTYSKTMNGIYPDILTQLILNKNDKIDFLVNFSESVVPKRYYKDRTSTGWDPAKTYLHLNNGQKAYYVSGSGTKTWEFNIDFPDGKEVETPLLKTLALANDSHTFTQNWQYSSQVANLGDTYVLTDYVGNPLTERANLSTQSIQSSIDWAKLAVDNTAPIIGFDFPSTGGTNARWGKMGGLSFNATDSPLAVPMLDPDKTVSQRPSMGIFRPSNTTSESGNVQTGLVYYIWSKNPEEPTLLTQNEFAAVKRYSLTGIQPQEYSGNDQKPESLLVANNYSDSVVPPMEAYTSENSGKWYLHAFTADMTWDSARQRIQYKKLQDLKQTDEGKLKYQSWLDEYEQNNGHNHISERELSPQAISYADGIVSTYDDYQTWIDEFEGMSTHLCPKPEAQPCDAAIDYAISMARKTDEYRTVAKQFDEQNPQYQLPVPNCADAVNYANYEGMKYAGDYDLWSDADYNAVDSNWVYNKTEIWLDNKIPEINIGDVSGNNLPVVEVSVSALDEHSGLKTFCYQFVNVNASPSNAAWVDFDFTNGVPETQTATATTFCNVITDGEYKLYVKAVDTVGNEYTVCSDDIITVNSESTIVREFSVPSNSDGAAVKSVDTTFSIGGLTNSIASIKYAVTDSVNAPETDYIELSNPVFGALVGETEAVKYQIPVIENMNGTKYLHIEVIESAGGSVTTQRKYHFYSAYKLDNTAPTVAFSPDGNGYPKQRAEVTVAAVDTNNGVAEKYILIKSGDSAPTVDTTDGWTAISGNILLDSETLLSEGEEADYIICVYVCDEAGNKDVIKSPVFKIYREAKDPGVPQNASSELLEISGDATGGFYGIVKADLGIDMKEGYSYSTCTVRNQNGNVTVIEPWSRWLPFTNFIKAKLPISNLNDRNNLEIWVKYKSPGGTISTEEQYNKIDASGKVEQGNLYATVERDILKTLPIGKEVTLDITVPAGTRVTPSANNPQGLIGNGKSYKAVKNACYAFDIVDMSNQNRKDILYVVVDNFDEIPPEGAVSYNIITPTNANVTATLETSEPVRVTNNGGQTSYIFKENGEFTFEFEDAAGNIGQYKATVDWIDKSTPNAVITKTYTYNSGSSTKEYNRITDSLGNTVLAQGVVLTPEKVSPTDKDFSVISNESVIKMTQNGKAEFTLMDNKGNKTVVHEKIENIISEVKMPEISYEFVDENGNSVEPIVLNGMGYANANVKVVLKGTVDGFASGNRVYDGNGILVGTRRVPVTDEQGNVTYEEKAVSNEIQTDVNGNYTLTKVYKDNGDITVAICDKLGNVARIPLEIRGIDKVAPEIILNSTFASLTQNQSEFDWKIDLGGYTVTDDCCNAESIEVSLAAPVDLTIPGKQTVTYIVKDAVGNTTEMHQNVYIMPEESMLVLGNNLLISAISNDKALLKTNVVSFNISRYDLMKVGGVQMANELATYDIYYYRGLFREGQMKYVAEKLTFEELTNTDFTVRFDKTGWYTVIVRNAEREREFTTFFISAME